MKPFTYKVLFTLVMLGIQLSYATTYYVATSGSNSNTGTLANPYKTITFGVSKLVAGDILYVRAGIYNEVVSISKNGTESNPITVCGYFDGSAYEVPVIDGGGTLPTASWTGLMNITGSYINVSHFEISNSSTNTYGIIFEAPGHHSKASYLKVHHNGQTGIMAKADYITAEDCEVYLNCMSNSQHLAGSGWGNGIGFAREKSNGITEYGIIRRCKVYNNHGEGVDAFEASQITIEDCEIYNNWTQNLYVSDASYVLVQRNLIYNTANPLIAPRNGDKTGISLFEERAGLPCYANASFTTPYSTNNTIINNLLYNAKISLFVWNEPQVIDPGFKNGILANNTLVTGSLSIGNLVHVNSQIRNNIFIGTASVPTKTGLTFSNNSWKTTPQANAVGKDDVIGDAKVAQTGSISAGEMTGEFFRLLANSPVINKAMVLPDVKVDFFKTVRDTTPDIGGYEYPFKVGISNFKAPSFRLFPNPATNKLTIELSFLHENEQLQIYNFIGKLIKVLNFSKLQQQINIEDLTSGIYFVRSNQFPVLAVKFIKL